MKPGQTRAMGFNLTNWDDISYRNYEVCVQVI